MLLIGAGKVVGATEVLLGTHIEVVVVDGIEYGVNALNGSNLDRTWGKSCILVGVVGRVSAQMVLPDALQLKLLQRKLDGRIGLQGHISLQTVQIHTRYHGLFGIVGRFFVNDAGQRADLSRRQTQRVGLRLAVALPEAVVLLLHALQQSLSIHVPVDVVGVGHKHRTDGTRVVTQLLQRG